MFIFLLMSTSFSSRALRTLRRLARPTTSFPIPSARADSVKPSLTVTPLRITLFRGGEGRTPLVRRRLRRALIDIPFQSKLSLIVQSSIRYGARAFQDRRFNHPKLKELRSLLRGEILIVELELLPTKTQSFTPANLQSFLEQLQIVLNRDFALNIVPSTTSKVGFSVGPSRRLIRLALPPLHSLEQSPQDRTFKIERLRPNKIQSILSAQILGPEQSVIPSIQHPVVSFTNSLHSQLNVINPVLNSCRTPYYSILQSLAFRAQKLLFMTF